MKILFEHEHLYYLPQFESIIHELKKRGEKNIFGSISLKTPDMEQKLFHSEMDRLGLEMIDANSELGRLGHLKKMNFDLIFIGNKNTLSQIKGNNSFSVMVYHGIGLKQSYYTDLTKEIDLICVESQYREKQLNDLGFKAVNTGFTKLDLIDRDIEKDNSLAPTILYAPTFFPSSLQKSIPFLDQLEDYNVKIKLHHFFWTNSRYVTIRSDLESSIKNLGNINLCTFETYNIMNLYPQTDILISDFSSTLFEYLFFNRPIIQTTYYTSRMKYKIFPSLLEKRIDRDRAEEIDFVFYCDNPEDLSASVLEAISNPEKHSNERIAGSKRFLGDTKVNSAGMVVNAIVSNGISIGEAN